MKKKNLFQRLQQKKYSSGAYSNPYFKEQKKTPTKRIIAICSVILVIIGFSIFLFSYEGLAIKNFAVTGLKEDSQNEFEKQINTYLNTTHLLVFNNTNRILFSGDEMRNSLSNFFAFESMNIKISGNTVSIDLKERTSQFVWKTGSERYLVDLSGTIIQKIDENQSTTIQQLNSEPLPIIVDKNNTNVAIGDRILSTKEIENIFLFIKYISDQLISTKEIQIDQLAGKWRGILTEEGYIILFDPSTDVSLQSEKLKTLLQNTLKDTSHLKYIDLRFGDHVYYK